MEGSKKNKFLEYNEEEEENSIDNDNDYKNIEGENILLRNNKKNVLKDLENYDKIQKEMEKYKGKQISYNDLQKEEIQEDNEESEEKGDNSEDNEENEDNSEDNNIKPNILNINNKEEEEEEEENMEEEDEISLQEKMEKQDERYLKTLSKVTKDEIRKGKNIKNQKELYETFVGIRIALQNLLLDINSLPSYQNFFNYLNISPKETKDLYQKLKQNINSIFFDSIIFHKEFLKKQNYPSSDQFNPVFELDKLIKNNQNINETFNENLEKIHNNLFKIDQKIMNIWYRKTVINQFQTNNKIIKKLSNNDNFSEHILSSVENNINTLLKKTQKYNITTNPLLGRKRLSENGIVEGRYDLTMKYLLNRNTKIKKNIDTKATKNKKIKYDKHEEIINFMVPENNEQEIKGRNIIINSLFGIKKLNINLDNKEKEEKKEARILEENDIDLI